MNPTQDAGGLVGIQVRVPKPGEIVAFDAKTQLYSVLFEGGLALNLGRPEVLKLINQSMASSDVLIRVVEHPIVGSEVVKQFGEVRIRGVVQHQLPQWNVFEVRYDNGLLEHVPESFIQENKYVPTQPSKPPPVETQPAVEPTPSVHKLKRKASPKAKPRHEMIAEHQRILRRRSPKRSLRVKAETIDLTLSDDDEEAPSTPEAEPKDPPKPLVKEPSDKSEVFQRSKDVKVISLQPTQIEEIPPSSKPSFYTQEDKMPVKKPDQFNPESLFTIENEEKKQSPPAPPKRVNHRVVEIDSEPDEVKPTEKKRRQTKSIPPSRRRKPEPLSPKRHKRYRQIQSSSSESEQEYVIPPKRDSSADSYDESESEDQNISDSASSSSDMSIEYDARGPIPKHQRSDRRIQLPLYCQVRHSSKPKSDDEMDDEPISRSRKDRKKLRSKSSTKIKPSIQKKTSDKPSNDSNVKSKGESFRIPKLSLDNNFRIPKKSRPNPPTEVPQPVERKSMADIVKEATEREQRERQLRHESTPQTVKNAFQNRHQTSNIEKPTPSHEKYQSYDTHPSSSRSHKYDDRRGSEHSFNSDRRHTNPNYTGRNDNTFRYRNEELDRRRSSSYNRSNHYNHSSDRRRSAERPQPTSAQQFDNRRVVKTIPPSQPSTSTSTSSKPAPPKVPKSIMRGARTEPFPLKSYTDTEAPFDWSQMAKMSKTTTSSGLKPDYLVRKEAAKQQRISSLSTSGTNMVPLGTQRKNQKEDVHVVKDLMSTTDPSTLRYLPRVNVEKKASDDASVWC